jgi:hypothetical protein
VPQRAHGMTGQIDRATSIQMAADQLTPAANDVSVVAWLGYDPPQGDESIVAAASSDRAVDGAVSLDHFVDGLRASHDGTSDHITAIGHSYGSIVVGEAASHGRHLAADHIVTAGSPGMDVYQASDLNVGARHVWAGSAADDPVSSPGPNIPVVGYPVADGMAIGHNTPPHNPGFGANVYHVDTHGHSGYWVPTSQSMQNQARIVVGLYDDVGLDSGKAPS